MKLLSSLILITLQLQATVWDIQTNDYLGKVAIECGDIVIVSKNNKIVDYTPPRCVTVILCESQECRTTSTKFYTHVFRTNGIPIIKVQ